MTLLELVRRAHGYRANELSQKLGFAKGTISLIENGNRAWSGLRKGISKVLDIDEQILFNPDGSAKKIPVNDVLDLVVKKTA